MKKMMGVNNEIKTWYGGKCATKNGRKSRYIQTKRRGLGERSPGRGCGIDGVSLVRCAVHRGKPQVWAATCTGHGAPGAGWDRGARGKGGGKGGDITNG